MFFLLSSRLQSSLRDRSTRSLWTTGASGLWCLSVLQDFVPSYQPGNPFLGSITLHKMRYLNHDSKGSGLMLFKSILRMMHARLSTTSPFPNSPNLRLISYICDCILVLAKQVEKLCFDCKVMITSIPTKYCYVTGINTLAIYK